MMTMSGDTTASRSVNSINRIFILGTARSGTTALSNQLCNHPQIVGFQTKHHYGIHECRFLSVWNYLFPHLEDPEELAYFLELFSGSDIDRMAEVDMELFYRSHPRSIIAFITMLTEEYVKDRGAIYFLNNDPKQSFYIRELVHHFPDAYYIWIKRDRYDTIRSSLKMKRNRSVSMVFRRTFRYHMDHVMVERNRGRVGNLFELDFEDFVSQPNRVMREIAKFLAIEWDVGLLVNPYQRNTSFRDKKERASFFGRRERRLVSFFTALFRMVPFSVWRKLRYRWDKQMALSRKNPFYYRLHPYAKYLEGSRFHRDDLVGED